MAEIRFDRVNLVSEQEGVLRVTVRACSSCGALVYDRDDAEQAHRSWHESLVTGDHMLQLARALDEPTELRERAAEFDRQAIVGMRERAEREGRASS